MRLPIVHNPSYDARFSPDHRFPMSKYRLLAEAIMREGLAGPGDFHVPAPAPDGWVKLAHDPAYVDQVFSCSVPEKIEREIGFPVTERTALRARCATAGTVIAARLALEHGVACNTAGGSHHAGRHQGAGYCTFNDVAVAAKLLIADGEIANALVLDLDVHQGDGTAAIFADDASVFTASVHAEKNYPARKKPSDYDLGLPDGIGDTAYLKTLALVLEELRDRIDARSGVLQCRRRRAWRRPAWAVVLDRPGHRTARAHGAGAFPDPRHPGLRGHRRRLFEGCRGAGGAPRNPAPGGQRVRLKN